MTFEHPWVRVLFAKYGLWYHSMNGGSPSCLRKLVTHEPFFARLDASFESRELLDEATLLESFGADYLRKYLLAGRFLQAELKVAVSPMAKEEQAERCRLQTKLASVAREPFGPLLKEYYIWLNKNGTSSRTMRLYLRAAEKFCRFADVGVRNGWDSGQLSAFVYIYPGARSSLFRFVTYCRNVNGWLVKMPLRSSVPSIAVKKSAVRRLQKLMERIGKEGVHQVELLVLEDAIALVFDYSLTVFRRLRWEVTIKNGRILLSTSKDALIVPTGMRHIVLEWNDRRYKSGGLMLEPVS